VAILEQSPLLTPCTETLCAASSERQSNPPPKHHVHYKGGPEFTVQIFAQSDTLPFLESFEQSLATNRNLSHHYVLAADYVSLPPDRPNRGSGYLKSGRTPVIIPKAYIMLEAYLRILAREALTDHADWAMGMVMLIREYVGLDGYLNVPMDQRRLSRQTGALFIEMFRLKRPVRHWLSDLRTSFGMDELEVVMDDSATRRKRKQAN
jgi:hypothetical protein